MNVTYNNKPAIMSRNGRLVLGEIAQKQRVSIDLSTTDWWATLVPGKYTLQIVAKAGNYIDSDKSAGVEVTKELQYDYKFENNVLQIYKAPYTFTDGTVRIGG